MAWHHNLYSTYSIVARDEQTGQLGVAVQTHQIGVGRYIIWMKAGRGAMITQSLANIGFGPMALSMLQQGVDPERIIAALVATDPDATRRQMGVVDNQGRAAAFTGSGCIREAQHHVGDGYSIQANMMTHSTVIPAMRGAYESATGDLAQRMIAALHAAQAEDGDIRGMQSAALRIVSGNPDTAEWQTVYDLRVDEHTDPITELGRLVRLRHTQIIDAEGYTALDAGDRERALTKWQEAREEAPELEELAFWQAITLADTHNDVATAAAILQDALADHPRRAQWLDLIGRLKECGLIERENVGQELLALLAQGS
ncbi:MAG: DUF1028 domain-containing protein [Chloroflexi bacterium]|nr:DUF1028 domain-containing protein [Chloroflexota bacterium]